MFTERFLKLSKIGKIKYKSYKYPELINKATPKTCTIKKVSGKWYAYITFEIKNSKRDLDFNKQSVGIDLGVK